MYFSIWPFSFSIFSSNQLAIFLKNLTLLFLIQFNTLFINNNINGIKHLENFKHIMYEQSFQRKLEIYELELLREKNLFSEDESIDRICNTSLKMYLVHKHNKYMKEAGKLYFYDNAEKKRLIDMKYSFCTSLEVASYVIDRCLKKF